MIKDKSNQSYITTDDPIWDLRPDSFYYQTVTVLLMWAPPLAGGREFRLRNI
jgi:hypothetical protein